MKLKSSLGANLRVTGHCNQGDRKHMEDMYCVAYQQSENGEDLEYAYFGIFDGHGGKEAAVFARKRLMEFIVNEKKFWSDDDEDVLSAIKSGYLATHNAMWKELAKWPKTASGLPSTSGTTATIAFIRNGKIYIGHVGDSSLVLGYQQSPGPPHESAWLAEPLTQDHKPESRDEISRIVRSGGKVLRKSGVARVVWNRPRIGHKGPVRRSTPIDEIPFLSVARSLGDLWSYNADSDQFVVSPEPDVRVVKIDTAIHRCLIFGTDGFWNMICPAHAVSIAQEADQYNERHLSLSHDEENCDNAWVNPSKRLVVRALWRWSELMIRADNTSVVTLFLNPPFSQLSYEVSKTTIVSHHPRVKPVALPPAALVTENEPVISTEVISSPYVDLSPLKNISSCLPVPVLQEEPKLKSPLNDILPLLNTKHTFDFEDFRQEKVYSGNECAPTPPESAIQCGEIDSSTSDVEDFGEPMMLAPARPESLSPTPNPIAASTPAFNPAVGLCYPRSAAFKDKTSDVLERRGRMHLMRGVLNGAGPSDKNVLPLSSNVETNSHLRGEKRRHSSVWDRRSGTSGSSHTKRTRSEDKSVLVEGGVCGAGAPVAEDKYNAEDAENERVAWPSSWLNKMRPCGGDGGSEENSVLNSTLRSKNKWIRSSKSPLSGLRQARSRSSGHLYLDRRDHSRTLRSDTNAASQLQRRTLRSRNIDVRTAVKIPALASKVASAKRGVHVRGLSSELSPFSRSSLLQASKSTPSTKRRARSSVTRSRV